MTRTEPSWPPRPTSPDAAVELYSSIPGPRSRRPGRCVDCGGHRRRIDALDVLRPTVRPAHPLGLMGNPPGCREGWTAVGMVNVALELTTEQALARLCGYAYSSTLDALADSLTTGGITVAALDA